MVIAASSETPITSSRISRSSTGGTNPAPIPWIRCGPGRPPEITGEPFGSTATTVRSGFSSLSRPPAPVTVPPVPTPHTSASTLPSMSRQISSAVVRRWMSGFAGLENWSQMNASPFSAAISFAAATASSIPPIDSVMRTSAP